MKFLQILLLTVQVLVLGCSQDSGRKSFSPDVLRIGVLPDQSKPRLLAQYTPLIKYLERETSLAIDFIISNNYSELLDDFEEGRLHLVNFGGLTFVQAEAHSGAKPLVMRDTDLNFTSCFFTRRSTEGQSADDFEGETFTFGPRLSTSGHLMPRRFLEMGGIKPEQFFSSVRHSSGHDESVNMVRTGEVMLGAANCVVVQSMLRDDVPDSDKIHIIATTPAYSNYVWAVQGTLSLSVRTALRDAFLALDAYDPDDQEILQSLGANGYLPAGSADFETVRLAAKAVGLLDTVSID